MRLVFFLLCLLWCLQSRAYGDTLVYQEVACSNLSVGHVGSVFMPKNRLFFIDQHPEYLPLLPKYELELQSTKKWTGLFTIQLLRATPKSEFVQLNIDSLFPEYYSEVFPRNNYQSKDRRWTSNYLLVSLGVGYNLLNRNDFQIQFAGSGICGFAYIEALKYHMKPYNSNELLERKIRFLPTPVIGASGRFSLKMRSKNYQTGTTGNLRDGVNFGVDVNVWTSPITGVITDKSKFTDYRQRSIIQDLPVYGSIQFFMSIMAERVKTQKKQAIEKRSSTEGHLSL